MCNTHAYACVNISVLGLVCSQSSFVGFPLDLHVTATANVTHELLDVFRSAPSSVVFPSVIPTVMGLQVPHGVICDQSSHLFFCQESPQCRLFIHNA